jgi:type IV secretion system protein VirD4
MANAMFLTSGIHPMIHRYRKTIYVLGIITVLILCSYASSVIDYALHGFNISEATPISLWTHMMYSGFNDKMFLALSLPVIAIISFVYWLLHRPRPIYGDARWARKPEIKKAKLFDKYGVILGKHSGDYLINGEQGHMLVTAPTGSGKGVGIVIPNLLAWKGSAIIMDVKLENFRLTSGFRAKYGRVCRFSPRDAHTHRFNPLDTVRRDPLHKIADIADIAAILIPSNSQSHDSMWDNEARDLFVALALYVIDSEQADATIGTIYRMLTADIDIAELMHYILEHETIDPACRNSFNNFIQKADKERSGVRSQLSSRLNLWKEPNIDAATSASDFYIEDFRKNKTSLYIGFALSDLDALAPLLNLFCQLAVKILVRHIPKDDEPHEVLMLIDEFPALGRMESLVKSIAVVREYKLRMMIIIQGLSQLDQLYKKEGRDFIMQNSALQVFYATNDESTTKAVSEKLGTTTIKTLTRNQNRNLKLTEFGSHAHSVTKREFMLPQEIRTLSNKKSIMFKENHRPILATKIRYYEDKVFQSRICDPAQVPELNITPSTALLVVLRALEQKSQGKAQHDSADAAKHNKKKLLKLNMHEAEQALESEITDHQNSDQI